MLAGGSKEEVDATLAMMKQAQDNAAAAAKNSYVPKQEPTFSPVLNTVPGFNGTLAQHEIRYVNGKPAPQPAPQPEI
jgi:hypothetical protein